MGNDWSAAVKSVVVAALLSMLVGCSGSAKQASETLSDDLDSADPALDAPEDSPALPPAQQLSATSPTANLSVTNTLVDSGTSTTLNWSSSDASGCTGSGAWSGDKGPSGSEQVGPLTSAATFTLTCSGAGGNAIAMLTVNVNGTLNVSWVAPTENVDGSALTDLAGYRVYYGDQSRNYLGSELVTDANVTSFNVILASGDYFVAMTATDIDGNESAYSNEVLKIVN